MRIKTCGLFRQEDIAFANTLKPDFVGFVFAPSRRQISFAKARELKKHLIDSIQVVGVFVDSPKERIYEIAKEGVIEMIQLHGEESEEYISELKVLCGLPIIKAVRVRNVQDLGVVSSGADYMLYDAPNAGSGVCFDWGFLEGFCAKKPYFLAGGIATDNLTQAMRLKPYAIDVSSGIESHGLKDFEKMAHIIRVVREFPSTNENLSN
ncbi:phosphoribosylanthranilate isomerase [uncultured Helicobacter sp.]|uniref:phosphoribosylanthranilate isomerase n=1 Tax=uncultured Helicobacter sp. TaxID=175537 RepID=UPI003752B7E1